MEIDIINQIIKHSNLVLKGKEEQVKLVICNLLAGGHTLIEDAPGVGKTTLVKYIGHAFGFEMSRIQFTNDLLPVDILGSSIFNKESSSFDFHKGPIFGELILADELNRAPPKTQSALLQAMEEKNISIEGANYILPEHFSVIATQNPHKQIGTFSLPESQLDRFSMKLKMGYPDKESTLELLKQQTDSKNVSGENNKSDQLTAIKKHIEKINIADEIYELIYSLLDRSRTNNELIPLSNRCGLDLVRVSRSWAYLQDRDYVIPDDIHYLFPYVTGHRLVHPESSDIDYEHKVAGELLKNI